MDSSLTTQIGEPGNPDKDDLIFTDRVNVTEQQFNASNKVADLKQLEGGFNNITGFLSLGKNIGIKPEALDFAVLCSDKVCAAAAVYTTNQVQGAPLLITKQHLADQKAQAIVVNSGIANVATGQQGKDNALKTTQLVAEELDIKPDNVVVASTGVIGPQLPMDKIEAGIKGVKSELSPTGNFAEAILTTDTHKKEICVEAAGFKIAGAAKGSGMISPNMATMLAFIATDADIKGDQLHEVLKDCVEESFNMMTVDMDASTSDMVVVMANGQVTGVNPETFKSALLYVCQELAKMIAQDGEGATKLIISEVNGAASKSDAKKAAKAIVSSNLVKTAVYGNDPNWGRLMMALGNSGAETFRESAITIQINGQPVVESGAAATEYDADNLSEIFKSNSVITIQADLGLGEASAVAYGCDMSEEYIKINAEYTT